MDFTRLAVGRPHGPLPEVGVWAEHTWPASGVERASSELLGSGSQVSGVSTATGNAHFVGSWIPIDQHPVSGAEGYGPQLVKSLPAIRETRVQSLGREDLLEKEMTAHSSILA
ncbi:unnamed protein product [Rangifer tarandus platyrhynchus]|uniref:Uncharacterized protein n=2 Tax=Rangifer tarandus platyrhynchus TaxID=3082113 RepID=A0AC59YY30_RANTA|nr:unnamed protein product [Rangifer tarandus platyrhynchus]